MKISALKLLMVSGGLTAFAIMSNAYAQLELNACQQTDPRADFVEITGGSTSCESGDFCCEINNGQGSCEAFGPDGEQFRAHSEVLPSGALRWWIDLGDGFSTILADGMKSVGAAGGSNCFYGYEPDRPTQPSPPIPAGNPYPDENKVSGAGYVKNNGTFAGVQSVIIFSDGVQELEQAVLPNIPSCDINGSGMVADVQVTCPTSQSGLNGALERWIIVAETRKDVDENNDNLADKNVETLLGFIDPTTGDIDPTNFCKCNKGDTAEGEDVPCNPNIQPGDEPATEGEYKGLPACTLDEALPTPVVIEIQNPTCIGAGSSRRCY